MVSCIKMYVLVTFRQLTIIKSSGIRKKCIKALRKLFFEITLFSITCFSEKSKHINNNWNGREQGKTSIPLIVHISSNIYLFWTTVSNFNVLFAILLTGLPEDNVGFKIVHLDYCGNIVLLIYAHWRNLWARLTGSG